MIQTILSTTITALVSAILGYCVSTIKKYREKIKTDKETDKEKEDIQNIALQTLLKNQLTNTYFVYSELNKIPDYIYQNFLDLLAVYEQLGGNSYIHTIAHKMENWEISKTDIL